MSNFNEDGTPRYLQILNDAKTWKWLVAEASRRNINSIAQLGFEIFQLGVTQYKLRQAAIKTMEKQQQKATLTVN